MDKIFNLKNYKIASLIFSFIFLFGGVFKVNDFSKLSFQLNNPPSGIAISFGCLFLLLSVIFYLELGIDLFGLNKVKITKDEKGNLCTKIANTDLIIHFNKIQEIATTDDSVIVLPANEFFDDECITDCKSALGAFIDKNFKNKIPEFQKEVKNKLQFKNAQVELLKRKREEPSQKSYGIGTCIFLDKPLNSTQRILLVSVTEQREGMGLYSNIAFIFKVVNEIHKEIADNRISNIYIPLIGSGHGQLDKKISLLMIIVAFAEILTRGRSYVKSLNIIIYKDEKCQDISTRTVKKILNYGVGIAVPNR